MLLPTLINTAEELFKNGEEKKSYVIEQIKTITNSNYAAKLAATKLEEILSTPQKKEN